MGHFHKIQSKDINCWVRVALISPPKLFSVMIYRILKSPSNSTRGNISRILNQLLRVQPLISIFRRLVSVQQKLFALFGKVPPYSLLSLHSKDIKGRYSFTELLGSFLQIVSVYSKNVQGKDSFKGYDL